MIPLAFIAGGAADVVGQQAYTTPGTYSWTAPAGVTKVCVVCVGAGNGRRAGGLGWKNNIAVTPGNSYTVVVGQGTYGNSTPPTSYFINSSTVAGRGGRNVNSSLLVGGSYVGDGGGNGGGGYLAGGGAGGVYW